MADVEKCKECGQPKQPDSTRDPAPKVTLELRCGTGDEFLHWLRHNIKLRGLGS